jgi:hypothetical protein
MADRQVSALALDRRLELAGRETAWWFVAGVEAKRDASQQAQASTRGEGFAMIKMNREQAITFLLHFTRVLQTDRTDLVTELLRDDETANAIAFILRHIANAVSEETTTSTRSFKKRKPGYAIEKRSLRIKREGGQ